MTRKPSASRVPARVRISYMPGSASGTRRPLAGSPRPAPFPPPSPQPCPESCSRASRVLQGCPTSHARSSAPHALRASCRGLRSLPPRRTRDLPVPKHDASLRARGLRSRGVLASLATISSFGVAFRRSWSASALPRRSFRDPISGPQVPLSTLQLRLSASSHDSGTSRALPPSSSGTFTPLRHAGLPGAPRLTPCLPLAGLESSRHII
jgi:hypothetical protein